MARGNVSQIFVISIVLLGLLTIRFIPNSIATKTANNESPNEKINPYSSSIDLPTTMNQNLSLRYQTVSTKYVSANCPTVVNKQILVNTTQNITALGQGELEIHQSIQSNDSTSPIANIEYSFIITNNSYLPINKSTNMPQIMGGEWEQNYPGWNNQSRFINHHEYAYLIDKYNTKIVNITQNGTQQHNLGNLTTTVVKYQTIYMMNEYREG